MTDDLNLSDTVEAPNRNVAPSPTPVHVNSATALMGVTGSGKSSLLATVAEYVMDTYRLATVLYSCDGGGIPAKVQALMRVGAIKLWRMRTRGEPFETTVKASRGYLPVRLDAKTGETAPGVKLVPPIQVTYVVKCPNGHEAKRTAIANQIHPPATCPTCKVNLSMQTIAVEREVQRTKGFETIGAVAYDGLTSMLAWQMDDLADRRARNELQGEEGAIGGRIQSGDLMLGANNRAHYGFVQSKAESMVANSLGIPGLAVPPVWTALTLEVTDDIGLPIVGLQIAGKAKTDVAGQWFGNCLEVLVAKDDEGNAVRRLQLAEFIDDQNRRHLIKHRGSPSMPAYLQDLPGQPWSQVNLAVFFQMLEADIAADTARAAAKYGTPELTEYTFGEDEPVAAAPMPSAPTVGRPPAPAPAPRPVGRPRKAAPALAGPAAVTTAAVPSVSEGTPEAPTSTASASTSLTPAPVQPVPAARAGAAPAPQPPEAAAAAGPVPPPPSATAQPPAPAAAPTPAPRPPIASAPRPGPTMGKPFAPPPGPRPPAPAPRLRPPINGPTK